MSNSFSEPILKTHNVLEGHIYHFHQDEEITQFLSEHPYLSTLYDEILKTNDLAIVVPLVALMDDERQEFDLQLIVRHETPSDLGVWDMYFAVDFVNNQTNLKNLFDTLKVATNVNFEEIIESIVAQLDDIFADISPESEPFVDITDELLAFGVNKA